MLARLGRERGERGARGAAEGRGRRNRHCSLAGDGAAGDGDGSCLCLWACSVSEDSQQPEQRHAVFSVSGSGSTEQRSEPTTRGQDSRQPKPVAAKPARRTHAPADVQSLCACCLLLLQCSSPAPSILYSRHCHLIATHATCPIRPTLLHPPALVNWPGAAVN